MPVPNTGGLLCPTIQDMRIGDYIYGTFENNVGWDIGVKKGTEYPVTGVAQGSIYPGYFYYIKVDTGLLIADRVVLHTVSWDELNAFSSRTIQGRVQTMGGISGIFRSPGGGCACADENGNMSLTYTGFGAWPVDNEWDEYIVRKDYGTGAGRDDVWHKDKIYTWCQETPILGAWISSTGTPANPTASSRITRGFDTAGAYPYIGTTSSTVANISRGFRPVFEYKE